MPVRSPRNKGVDTCAMDAYNGGQQHRKTITPTATKGTPMTDSCKLCGRGTGVHWHHEIPQAYGGVNGPQTPLCGGHHTLVHNLALELYRTKDEQALRIPPDIPKDRRPELLRLVRTIVIARQKYEEARSKGKAPKRGAVMKLDSKRATRLETMARLMNCSQQDVANAAIDRLYQSLTAKAGKEQLQNG